MSNLTITNVDQGSLIIADPEYQDGTYVSAGVHTLLAGTILARDSVSQKLVIYVKGGSTNENGIPKAVLSVETDFTGAADFPLRPLISAKVRRDKLVIDADGDDSNIDAAILDLLRSMDIIAFENRELSELDNQ